MKSELKSGLRVGDSIEGEPEDGILDSAQPSTGQPDTPAAV